MRAILCFAVMLLSITAVLSAQETTPSVEVFGGYSYANAGNPSFGSQRVNLNGWNSSLAVNFNRTFGIVGDFSGHYGSSGSSIAITCVIGGNCSNAFNLTTKTTLSLRSPDFLPSRPGHAVRARAVGRRPHRPLLQFKHRVRNSAGRRVGLHHQSQTGVARASRLSSDPLLQHFAR